jgi:hypothetical protein
MTCSTPPRPWLLAAILLVAALPAASAPARAVEIPGPTVDFSGVLVIRIPPSKPLTIKIDYTAKRVRREMAAYGTHFITIVDRTRDRTVVLFPDLKRYAVRPLIPGEHDTVTRLARNAQVERVGTETIGGVETVKYRLQGRSPRGRPFRGFLWLTPQNVMIRMEGETVAKDKKRRITIEMRDLHIGPVDPAVFAIPAGYQKVKNKK